MHIYIDICMYAGIYYIYIYMYVYIYTYFPSRLRGAEVLIPLPQKTSVLVMTLNSGEVPQMLEPFGVQSTPSLPLFPGPLHNRMVTPDRALSIG